ncbi:uncharacterized protein LOC129771695 [Toxorhynchites rutilus septentrionalis]|uniref:uncharacterized protein LOC129771695 n=1 Tax=Toxorhynchites rutilus septentrionalis TaxID=329112 RepID=UPI00247A674D|nr:uncharacterized protein LOC129771695 [Toxorhynchites rutilus septentrionalis]
MPSKYIVTVRCILEVLMICRIVNCNSINGSDDSLHYLRNLRLEHLLKLRTLVSGMLTNCQNSASASVTNGVKKVETNDTMLNDVVALSLINNFSRREMLDHKPTKIQSIFQVSVTSLAFLSFAGYLLCMIVQAIKSNGITYYHPTTTSISALPSVIKRQKKT